MAPLHRALHHGNPLHSTPLTNPLQGNPLHSTPFTEPLLHGTPFTEPPPFHSTLQDSTPQDGPHPLGWKHYLPATSFEGGNQLHKHILYKQGVCKFVTVWNRGVLSHTTVLFISLSNYRLNLIPLKRHIRLVTFQSIRNHWFLLALFQEVWSTQCTKVTSLTKVEQFNILTISHRTTKVRIHHFSLFF